MDNLDIRVAGLLHKMLGAAVFMDKSVATKEGMDQLMIFLKIATDSRLRIVESEQEESIYIGDTKVGWMNSAFGIGEIYDNVIEKFPEFQLNRADKLAYEINLLASSHGISDVYSVAELSNINVADIVTTPGIQFTTTDDYLKTMDSLENLLGEIKSEPLKPESSPESNVKLYTVTIEEILSKTVCVEADSMESALNIVENMYRNEEIILYSENCIDTNFSRPEEFQFNDRFNYEQIKQIRKGLEKGLNVSVYADSKFNWYQMRVIRKGLEAGVDVSIYAKSEFTSMQMEQILWGLESKVDVSLYADPKLDWQQMAEILRSLDIKDDLDI